MRAKGDAVNPENTHDMMIDTIEGLLLPVYRQAEIPRENITALWGIAHWWRDMVNQLAGEG